MQFSFTSEQEEFRSVLRRFLEEKSPTTVVRRLMYTETCWERENWRELNQQLGLTAVHIPEAYVGQLYGAEMRVATGKISSGAGGSVTGDRTEKP